MHIFPAGAWEWFTLYRRYKSGRNGLRLISMPRDPWYPNSFYNFTLVTKKSLTRYENACKLLEEYYGR